MEVKANAIVIKTVDYKDNDKILTLYSLEYGKITATIKGVKKSGAKLKFASEPFCFCEYILAVKGGRYTVINATHIDTFYNLRLNLKKYYAVALLGEFANKLLEEEIKDEYFFDLLINGVKNLCYEDNEYYYLSKFLIDAIQCLGYGITDYNCFGCGEDIKGRVFFSFKNAEFSCLECRQEGYNEIMPITYEAFKEVINGIAPKSEGVEKLIRFLVYYVKYKTETNLKSAEALYSLFVESA